MSWQTLQLVEESRWNDNHLLSTVSRLAQALGLRLTDVLTPDREPRSEPADAATIGTALAAHPDGLTNDVLARALGWPMQRVHDAITILANELRAVGQTIRRVDGHNQLAPATTALDSQRVQTLARASRPLDPDHARVLLRVLRGHSRSGYWTEYTADEHQQIMDLIDQGVLIDTGATVRPSIETREALTPGRRRSYGDFPQASRFRTPTDWHTTALQRARAVAERLPDDEVA